MATSPPTSQASCRWLRQTSGRPRRARSGADELAELGLGGGARVLGRHFALLEEQERREAANTVASGYRGRIVDVDGAKLDFPFELSSDLGHDGSESLAGPAPFG